MIAQKTGSVSGCWYSEIGGEYKQPGCVSLCGSVWGEIHLLVLESKKEKVRDGLKKKRKLVCRYTNSKQCVFNKHNPDWTSAAAR